MRKILNVLEFEITILIAMIIFVFLSFMCIKYTDKQNSEYIFYEETEVENYQIEIYMDIYSDVEKEIMGMKITNLEDDIILMETMSYQEMLLMISIVLFFVINIIILLYIIIHFIIVTPIYFKNRKLIKENFANEEDLYYLPKYDAIVANAVYKKRYQFEGIYEHSKNLYRSKGVLTRWYKFNVDNDFDENSLKKIEKFIFDIIKNGRKEDDEKTFEKMINEELEQLGYYKENKVRTKIKEYLNSSENIVNWFANVTQSRDLKPTLIRLAILFIGIVLLSIFKFLVLIPIACCIWLIIKYYRISLTSEGEIERARLYFVFRNLKRKKELTSEEKEFFEMIQNIM